MMRTPHPATTASHARDALLDLLNEWPAGEIQTVRNPQRWARSLRRGYVDARLLLVAIPTACGAAIGEGCPSGGEGRGSSHESNLLSDRSGTSPTPHQRSSRSSLPGLATRKGHGAHDWKILQKVDRSKDLRAVPLAR